MLKIVLVAGARPNFMKIAPLWHVLSRRSDLCEPVLVHTGQHYDANMSDVFFRDLGLPTPDIHLGVGSGSHAVQTASVMTKFEEKCLDIKPDLVVVVGDVNSTLACAITAKKLWIPVAHVEAGLRSRNWKMPEEINRIVTDSIADYLFTPSGDADRNLTHEGVAAERIHLVGNIMIDSLVRVMEKARDQDVLQEFGLTDQDYGLITLHRPSNVDGMRTFERIVREIASLEVPTVFPVHPRTRKMLQDSSFGAASVLEQSPVILTDPVAYLDFVQLMMNASFVITDSGGIQEETTYLGIPCLTLRPQTERPITITEGTNEIVTVDTLQSSAREIQAGRWKQGRIPDLWDGKTAERIAEIILVTRPPTPPDGD